MGKNSKKCTPFEEMLMWTSYRYCIGRTSYVSSMARDIAVHYYGRLSPDREEFTADDIRREIGDHLRFMPFFLDIRRTYGDDPYDPVNVIMGFIKKEGVTSVEKLNEYSKVTYDAHTQEYKCEKRAGPFLDGAFDGYSLECLIGWNDLASCFDRKNHKFVTVETEGGPVRRECFLSWVRKSVPVPDKPGYFMHSEFGWDECWVPVEEFIRDSRYRQYLLARDPKIVCVEDYDKILEENSGK